MTGILSPDLKDDLKEKQQANNMDEVISQIAAYPTEGDNIAWKKQGFRVYKTMS